MADLIAIVFETEAKAEEVRNKILAMTKDYLIDIGDAAIAVKTDDGKVKLNQLMNTDRGRRRRRQLLGPAHRRAVPQPADRGGRGAASGAIAGALTDVGVNDKFMKGLAEADIQPGEAILFVLVKSVTGDKVLEGLKGVGGRILQTSLDHTREERLRKALAGQAALGNEAQISPAKPAGKLTTPRRRRVGRRPTAHIR